MFNVGETVKVVDGYFRDFGGKIEEVNRATEKLRVVLTIFGRPTIVDLDFQQISKEG